MAVARGLKLIRNWDRSYKIFMISYSWQSEGGSSVSQKGSWQCSSGSGARRSTWLWWSRWSTFWIWAGPPCWFRGWSTRWLWWLQYKGALKEDKDFLVVLPMRSIWCLKLYLTRQKCYWWRRLAFRWWAPCHQETAECRNCQQRDHDEPQTPRF